MLVLASGSSGNCIFIQAGKANILVDAGISCSRIEYGLSVIGINPQDLDAIFISHEHSDHIAGLLVFEKRYNKKIIATEGTLNGIKNIDEISDYCDIISINQFSEKSIKGVRISTFKLDHDALEPIGLNIVNRGFKISIATDLGYVSDDVFKHLKKSNLIVLESNYDEKMLLDGGYPWFLKNRITGKNGHLSNEDFTHALLELNWEGLTHVYAAHISRENNTNRKVSANYKAKFKNAKHIPALNLTRHDCPCQCFMNYK